MSSTTPDRHPHRRLHDLAAGLDAFAADRPGAQLVSVSPGPGTDPLLSTHPLGDVADPLGSLVGFVAPRTWSAVGISSPAHARPLDEPDRAGPARITVLLDRHGAAATVLTPHGRPPQLLHEPPDGRGIDLLSRVLQRPTPAPGADESIATWLESLWLDLIATRVFAAPLQPPTWGDLTPLHPAGRPVPIHAPQELAARTSQLDRDLSWRWFRRRLCDRDAPARAQELADRLDGSVAAPSRWFDDGSCARFQLGRFAPTDVLLSILDDHLAPGTCRRIRAALTRDHRETDGLAARRSA